MAQIRPEDGNIVGCDAACHGQRRARADCCPDTSKLSHVRRGPCRRAACGWEKPKIERAGRGPWRIRFFLAVLERDPCKEKVLCPMNEQGFATMRQGRRRVGANAGVVCPGGMMSGGQAVAEGLVRAFGKVVDPDFEVRQLPFDVVGDRIDHGVVAVH